MVITNYNKHGIGLFYQLYLLLVIDVTILIATRGWPVVNDDRVPVKYRQQNTLMAFFVIITSAQNNQINYEWILSRYDLITEWVEYIIHTSKLLEKKGWQETIFLVGT